MGVYVVKLGVHVWKLGVQILVPLIYVYIFIHLQISGKKITRKRSTFDNGGIKVDIQDVIRLSMLTWITTFHKNLGSKPIQQAGEIASKHRSLTTTESNQNTSTLWHNI